MKKYLIFFFMSILLLGVVSAGLFDFLFSSSVDPPEEQEIGYEFLDDNKVVHIWNTQDDYYFETEKGIQLTNHYKDYWTKNIFCVGFYNPSGNWIERACADSFDSIDLIIETDNETYVKLSFAKDFEQEPIPLRLGTNYYLGLNDKNLTINLSTKNIGTHPFPQELGFAWKVTDWDIPHEGIGGDSIFINNVDYDLDGIFDLTFKDMQHSYFDDELNETITEYDSYFRGYDWTKFLRVDWNKNLNYAVKLYGNGNQEDFYIALLINVGLFDAEQEKSTTFQWIDAEGDYTGIHWDIAGSGNGDARGMTTDNTNIWIVDKGDDKVYKYDMAGNIVTSWATGPGNTFPNGVATDGSNIWTGDSGYADVYKRSMDGTQISNWDVQGDGNDQPRGITTNGSYIWVVEDYETDVHYWDMNGDYISNWDTAEDGNLDPCGITTDNINIYTIDTDGHQIFKWDMNGNYISNFSVVTQSGDPWGITTNGTYLWITDDSDDEVYLYEMAPSPVVDETPPTYSNVNHNTTIAGANVNFSITYDDDTALEPNGQYIFSTNNTGVWVNDTLCGGTLDCSVYGTETPCENCPQCNWAGGTPDYTDKSCGNDCSGGDYIYKSEDSCTNYILADACAGASSCDGTDTVVDLWINGTTFLSTDTIDVVMGIMCYGDDDEHKIWYYNGIVWTEEFYDATCEGQGYFNITTSIEITSAIPTQYIRGQVTYGTLDGDDECYTGAYGDNDDISFTVVLGNCSNDGECSSCLIDECDTNCSDAGCSLGGINFISTPQSISTIKTLSSTPKTIGYRWYATDNAGNRNDTGVYTLTITSADCWSSTSWGTFIPDGCVYHINSGEAG